jgi:LacI family transcriptional regulator
MTIAQIAELADTSVATVSKVLNGRVGVSAKKRETVLKLLTEHGYARRGAGQRKPSYLIDFVLRGTDTLWSNTMLTGAEEEATNMGVGLVVSTTHGQDLGNKRWVKALQRRGTDGIILVVSRLKEGIDAELARLRIPIVLVDRVGSEPTSAPVVGATNMAGGITATEHLINLGHERIAIITGPDDLTCSVERLDGYRAAMTKAGLPVREDYIKYGNFQADGGRAAAAQLLDLREPPTAIFAGSDLQAFGVIEEARARRLNVPKDLSVVGFDNVDMCRWMTPRLTTIHQPLDEMARTATRILMDMAYRDQMPASPKSELATHLVMRESTAPPRRD